ncbi:MAG TPA: alpha/beta fold hydrolase, partial [Chitinophagaceae bacterium]
DKTIQYGATITTPQGNGSFPAVILITGSGQQNRDEEIAGHKPFAVIADHLTRKGFIVLRVDDRGVGQSTGEVNAATSLDFYADVSAGIDYLKSRKETDKRRIALIGHSEGGMIAQMQAAQRKDIAAIVLLAAPGISGADVLIEQNKEYFTVAGLPKDHVAKYIELYSLLMEEAKRQSNPDSVKAQVKRQVEDWVQRTPNNIVVATTGIMNEKRKAEFIEQFSATLSNPWIQYFIHYNPKEYIERISCPVFALNGSKDIQVISTSNLSAIEDALKKSRTKDYQTKEYDGLNHLFQKCKTCTTNEYTVLDETISVEVLADIATWLTSKLRL